MTTSERRMTTRLARRDFLAAMTAAGLATVAGGEPRLRADEPVEHPKPTADTCILLWMAGGMARAGDVRPEALRAVRGRRAGREDPLHVPGHRHRRGQHQDHAGAGEHRQGDGPRHAHPLARRRRPRQHPALAAPVPLAHRLRPAADGGVPAHRRVDRPRARAAEPGHPAVHQHRPAARRASASRRS